MNDWTLMVYISADDILANFAVESLKQMKRAAGKGVVVVAQFDSNQGDSVAKYAFSDSKKSESSIDSNLIAIQPGPVDMTDPATLADFINTTAAKYPAKHYGLVLWGHGPELLFDDNVPTSTPPSSRRYFTPAKLRQALEYTTLVKKQPGKARLDIVAIDACCMASVESVGALQGCAGYLIASQDEVPDASFPYAQVLTELKRLGKKGSVRDISELVPNAYQEAFQDYIATPANGLRGITLSTLNLDAAGTITTPLKQLASALLQASSDVNLGKKVLDARRASHDFEFGLFVDLFDFCEQLDRTGHGNNDFYIACKNMREAIDGKNSGCIIENQASGISSVRCHGISVYFPYQTADPVEDAVLLRTTGTKNGTDHPIKDRIQRISELEEDYSVLQTSGQADWLRFIKLGWSLILTKEVPEQLDVHYSAQQCARNLLPAADGAIMAALQPKKSGPQPGPQKLGPRPANGGPKGLIVSREHRYPAEHQTH